MLVNNTVRVKMAMLLNSLTLKFEYCGPEDGVTRGRVSTVELRDFLPTRQIHFLFYTPTYFLLHFVFTTHLIREV